MKTCSNCLYFYGGNTCSFDENEHVPTEEENTCENHKYPDEEFAEDFKILPRDLLTNFDIDDD